MTLLMPSTGVFRIASTCHMRLSSYPQLVWRKVLTVSLVGEAAVKFAGSGGGNTGGAVGPGAEGSEVAGGAGGTFCCADTSMLGNEIATSAARMEILMLATRRDIRIKLILLLRGKAPRF